jgi:hypothetical protein
LLVRASVTDSDVRRDSCVCRHSLVTCRRATGRRGTACLALEDTKLHPRRPRAPDLSVHLPLDRPGGRVANRLLSELHRVKGGEPPQGIPARPRHAAG